MANFNLDDYVGVHERITKFYAEYPNGRINTELLMSENDTVIIKALVYRERDDAEPSATGHSSETKGDGYVNKTSHLENCETSAIGRALANLGFEIKKGIASREEMQKIQRMNEQENRQRSNQQGTQEINTNFGGYTDGFPDNPIARSLSDLVTAKQLGMIRALARELGIDPDEECQAVMKINTDELSKKAASAFIKYLQEDNSTKPLNQEQSISEPVKKTDGGTDILNRVSNARKAITELGVEPFNANSGETAEQYFDRLTAQYKAIPKPQAEPDKKTADKTVVAQKKGKSNGMVTLTQMADLQALIPTTGLTEEDIVGSETDGKKMKFSELTELEAGQIIISLS